MSVSSLGQCCVTVSKYIHPLRSGDPTQPSEVLQVFGARSGWIRSLLG